MRQCVEALVAHDQQPGCRGCVVGVGWVCGWGLGECVNGVVWRDVCQGEVRMC